jgi:hypothetical protein
MDFTNLKAEYHEKFITLLNENEVLQAQIAK